MLNYFKRFKIDISPVYIVHMSCTPVNPDESVSFEFETKKSSKETPKN